MVSAAYAKYMDYGIGVEDADGVGECQMPNCGCRGYPYDELDQPYIEPEPFESVTQEAMKLVYGGRAKEYGHPAEDFGIIADLWSTILSTDVKPEDVPIMMVALKLARAIRTVDNGTWHRDTWVDIAGYAQTAERLQRRKEGLE